MSNSHDIVCKGDPDVQRYICPCDYLKSDNFGLQKGGNDQIGYCGPDLNNKSCLGADQIPLGVNPGCKNFPPSSSEIAWDYRYTTGPSSSQRGGKNSYYKKYKKYKALYKELSSKY